MYQTILTIDGMACSMCESHVNDAIRRACRCKSVRSSFKKGRSEILSEEAPEESALRAAIEATGYRVLGCETEPYRKKGLFGR